MMRRHRDAAALFALALFAVRIGEPRPHVKDAQFRFTSARHASAARAAN